MDTAIPRYGSRQDRQRERQRAITDVVLAEGSVRIEHLAERFGISLMTVHRDLDELESRGVLRKSRGLATATSTSLIESSGAYRASRQLAEKEALAVAAMEFVEPGQALFLDDSTTVMHMARHLPTKAPITVITNFLTVINELSDERDVSLIALGGEFHKWCSAFMGRVTIEAIAGLRADMFIMSTAAVVDDVAFHQASLTADTKKAMFAASARRILLVDHTKFERRALHAVTPLSDFDAVIVDAATEPVHVRRLKDKGVRVVVASRSGRARHVHDERPAAVEGAGTDRAGA